MLFGMVSRPGLAVKLLGSGDERFSITGSLALLGWTEADDAVKNYGVPVMMEVVKLAAPQLFRTFCAPVAG